MDDALAPVADLDEFDAEVIERAVLNDTEEGRRIAAMFVKVFGDFVTTNVRPVLVQVAGDGGEPQLLVNGLAALLRATAEAIEFPLGHPRSGSPRLDADGVEIVDDGRDGAAGPGGPSGSGPGDQAN
jgi:hypothetical protein